jgi:hypothetical protein
MPSPSKLSDPRFWEKWRPKGALSSFGTKPATEKPVNALEIPPQETVPQLPSPPEAMVSMPNDIKNDIKEPLD